MSLGFQLSKGQRQTTLTLAVKVGEELRTHCTKDDNTSAGRNTYLRYGADAHAGTNADETEVANTSTATHAHGHKACKLRPSSRRHKRAVLSRDAVTTCLPLGITQTDSTSLLSPSLPACALAHEATRARRLVSSTESSARRPPRA
eukprot:1725083-Pleurochrysis_carterae.AAC.1